MGAAWWLVIASLLRAQAPSHTSVRALAPGQPLEAELQPGEIHSYRMALSAGQVARVELRHGYLALAVKISSPDNRDVIRVPDAGDHSDPLELDVVAASSGTYQLDLLIDEHAAGGRYSLELVETHPAAPEEVRRAAALGAFFHAEDALIPNDIGARHAAVESFNAALQAWQELGDRKEQAWALGSIAAIERDLGEGKKALTRLQGALALARAAHDQWSEAAILYLLGFVESNFDELTQAREHLGDALRLCRDLGNRRVEAWVLIRTGDTYRNTEPVKASDYYNRGLILARAEKSWLLEATALKQLGNLYSLTSDMTKAKELLEQSLAIYRASPSPVLAASTIHTLGNVSYQTGDLEKAREHWEAGLELAGRSGDTALETLETFSLGVLWLSRNEPQKSLDYLERAREMQRTATVSPANQAQTLGDIALALMRLGDGQKALARLNEALALVQGAPNKRAVAEIHMRLGQAYELVGSTSQALDQLLGVVALLRELSDRSAEANVLNEVSRVYSEAGDTGHEWSFAEQALEAATAVGNRHEQARALDTFGLATLRTGDYPKALDYGARMLAIARSNGLDALEQRALFLLARAEGASGNLGRARELALETVERTESVRGGLADSGLRLSFAAQAREHYEFLIDVLMRLHEQSPDRQFAGEALAMSERARARSLLETLGESAADIRQGVDPALVERERDLLALLRRKTDSRLRLLAGKHTQEQLDQVQKEIEGYDSQIQEIEVQIRATSPRYAALTRPQPLTAAEIQAAALDDDTLLLEYFLGKNRSFLWVVSPSGITAYDLPPRQEIEATAKSAYQEVERGARAPALGALSRMLLKPIETQLGTKRLLIVADGALQYVPFAALPEPSSPHAPLLARHEVVTAPSASTVVALRRESAARTPAPKLLAVLADPVFDRNDPRVNGPTGGATTATVTGNLERSAKESGVVYFDRLLFSRREADGVAALAGSTGVRKAVDFEASLATATSPSLADYRIVHFATHGLVNSQHAELSGLVFSLVDRQGQPQNGFLQSKEVYNLKLGADLVVLSACQTALGKEINGEGLVGLTRGFMYAGVPSVVATLWRVSDRATAEMMQRFYRGMLSEGLRPAAALRAAQDALRAEKRWSAPYYWAGFVLQGEWR
jgi:CHAT domain-containing protein/Tfp pilus assembly protein PilF